MHVARMKKSPDSLKHHEREANPSPCSGTTYTCQLMIQQQSLIWINSRFVLDWRRILRVY